jgi:hypothetical protein
MRKIACARAKGSDTFDVVATTSDTQPAFACPLAEFLVQIQGEPHYKFLDLLLQKGILRRAHGPGIYEFTPVDHPCPFAQPAQPTTQPLEKQQ